MSLSKLFQNAKMFVVFICYFLLHIWGYLVLCMQKKVIWLTISDLLDIIIIWIPITKVPYTV